MRCTPFFCAFYPIKQLVMAIQDINAGKIKIYRSIWASIFDATIACILLLLALPRSHCQLLYRLGFTVFGQNVFKQCVHEPVTCWACCFKPCNIAAFNDQLHNLFIQLYCYQLMICLFIWKMTTEVKCISHKFTTGLCSAVHIHRWFLKADIPS